MENNFEFKEYKEPVQEAFDAVTDAEKIYKGNKNQHIPMTQKSRLTIKVEKTNTGYSCYTVEVPGLCTVGADMTELHDNYFEVLQHHCDYSNENYDSKITINDFQLLWELSHDVMISETVGMGFPRLTGSDFDKLYAAGANTPEKPKSEVRKLLDQIFSVFKRNREKQFVGGFVSNTEAIKHLKNQRDEFNKDFEWNKETGDIKIYQDPNELAIGGRRLEDLKKAIELGAAYIQNKAIRGNEPFEFNYPLKIQAAGLYGAFADSNGNIYCKPVEYSEAQGVEKPSAFLFNIDKAGDIIPNPIFGIMDMDLIRPGFSEAIITHEEVGQAMNEDAILQKQYDLRSFRTDRNNFEWSEKVYQDTAQFFADMLGHDKFERWGNIADDGHADYNPELYKSLDQLIFPVGTKLHLEVEVTNIWFSRMLSKWLYDQSEFDKNNVSDIFKANRFEPMGLFLHGINWHGVHTLNEFERESLQTAVNIIQSKLSNDEAAKDIKVTL